MEGIKTNRSILRGLSVIEALAAVRGGLTLTGIAERTGLDKGTVTRLLLTLIEAGYVRRETDGRQYFLTTRILQIAGSAGIRMDVRSAAHPHLRSLRDEINEIVHLGIVENDRVVYIDKLEPHKQALQIITGVGQSMSVHSTALGKCILAHMARPEAEAIIARLDLAPVTANTITDRRQLIAELDRIHSKGYATDDEENMDAVSCVAAPVFDNSARIVAAISSSLPTFRIQDGMETLAGLIRNTAANISSDLGYRPAS